MKMDMKTINFTPFKQVPIWGWLSIIACCGVFFLVWHQYASDVDDTDWNNVETPPEVVTPSMIEMIVSAQHAKSHPFRSREYPANLMSSSASIIGEF